MTTQTLTLNVPDSIYRNLKHRAEQSRRSVEEETINLLTTVPGAATGESTPAVAAAPAAREIVEVLEALRQKQREGLTALEAKLLELAAVWEECKSPNWDGGGALPVKQDALRFAYFFLEALPPELVLPSIGVEPDGHLTLEWYRRPRWTLSISVSPEADLFYAAMFGANDVRGREVFQGEIPEHLLNLIRRACAPIIDPHNVPPVSPDERLARFVTQSSQFRKSDQTVKQDAFIPHPHLDLSVTRHLQASDLEIWDVGRSVAGSQGRTLHGRADIQAADCLVDGLVVVAKPIASNPNHSDISNWPTPKQDQKAIALKLAAAATFVPNPGPS